jgi:hypothetical protein
MKVIKPPSPRKDVQSPSIFLAGSIEMGSAEDWQTKVEKHFEAYVGTIFNPRRDDWDKSWAQTVSNPEFKGQVTWEWKGLEEADYILMHFDPDTKAIISFGEFARHFDSGKIFVSCPKGWWRRGNVEVLCDLAGIPVYESLEEATAALTKEIESRYEKSAG